MSVRRRITLILLIIFTIGLSVLLYPSFANFWNSKTQSKMVTDYEDIVRQLDTTEYTAIIEKAEAYNKALSQLAFPLSDYEQIEGYEDILNVNQRGMMGYLIIDKIQVQLPIYHGVSDSVLGFACGHIQGSSFPVGGETTHAVLSAHRGLPSAKLFTNLDRLEIGDIFKVTVLDREYLYEVDQIRTVLPSDTNDIQLEKGKDYCTLLTCTPYGINTHRLLVRGVRIDTVLHRTLYVTSEAYRISTIIVTASVALPILIVLILIVIFRPAKKKATLDNLNLYDKTE